MYPRHIPSLLMFAFTIAGCSTSSTRGASVLQTDASTPGTHDASPNSGADANAGMLRNVCSGCAKETLDRTDKSVRFHHVHLNVTDPAASRAFYTKFFAAESVRLNDKADALWLAPMLFLLNKVAVAPNDTLEMGLDHVGRGSDDPAQWFDEVSKQGVMGDPRQGFQSTPAQLGSFTFVYVRGPDAERMEVYSSGTVVVPGHVASAKDFQHAHFVTADVDSTVAWYSALLELPANPSTGLGRDIAVDRVALFFAGFPLPNAFAPTDDRPLGHIALSVSDLAMMRARAEALGIEIVAEPSVANEGFRSFFVRAPDRVLLEFVEAGPIENQ
jgi:catechol 2,3-dioxygenase-like lactoylglutathione lyase family enzyme